MNLNNVLISINKTMEEDINKLRMRVSIALDAYDKADKHWLKTGGGYMDCYYAQADYHAALWDLKQATKEQLNH